jgi:hypothetical protein
MLALTTTDQIKNVDQTSIRSFFKPRPTKYILNRPNYLVFVDEVGDNASQKDDGNIGGTKYVVRRKNRALMRAVH